MTEPALDSTVPDADDGDWNDDEEEDDDDDDIEMSAAQLHAQLLADISRVNANPVPPPQVVNTATLHAPTPKPIYSPPEPPPRSLASSKKEQDLIATMKAILTFLESDDLARTTLETTIIPDMGGASVFNVITSSVSSKRVPKEIAMPLHASVVALASTNSLFGNLRRSNASSIQLDKGKRKREQDEGMQPKEHKRTYAQHYDLNSQLMEAVGVVSHALATSQGQPLHPLLISPIQIQLHRIFLFAVTSAQRGGLGMNALQEIAGLIQVIGVLTGVSIGQSPPSPPLPSQSTQYNGIGTAVYPCLMSGCQKTFSRLYSLRNHQRAHAVERPYHCSNCPASFVRNHDLKRHVKLHDKKAWKCSGCDKMFSRRDAIKRHKKLSQNHGPRGEACVHGEVIEVTNADEDDNREEKRAKMWNGIAVSVAMGGIVDVEEGEIQPSMLSGLQTTVLTLHPILQSRVSNALVTIAGPISRQAEDPSRSQATLASVIARAQIYTKTDSGSKEVAATSEGSAEKPTKATTEPSPPTPIAPPGITSLSMYGLSDEQAEKLELAISGAAKAAQAQAEAEAALEEQEEEFEDDAEYDEDDGEDLDFITIPPATST